MPAFTSHYEQALAWLNRRVIRPFYADRARRLILQSFPFWIASLLTGLLAVSYEKVFGRAEQVSFTWLGYAPVLACGLTAVACGLSWGLMQRLAPAARGSGIPQVMASSGLSNPVHHPYTDYLTAPARGLGESAKQRGAAGRPPWARRLHDSDSGGYQLGYQPVAGTDWPRPSRQASFLTGVVRSPFTAAVLVLEMTDRYSLYEHLQAGFIRETLDQRNKPPVTTAADLPFISE